MNKILVKYGFRNGYRAFNDEEMKIKRDNESMLKLEQTILDTIKKIQLSEEAKKKQKKIIM